MPDLADFAIQPQPDDRTCGPTCLHAVYRFFGDPIPLEQVLAEAPMLDSGGTLGVLLGTHALSRGYAATLYTYNLTVFDPSWFPADRRQLQQKLRAQLAVKQDPALRSASEAYLEFLQLGGQLRFEDLTPELLRRNLQRSLPILTGLSATYLYRTPREIAATGHSNDVEGQPVGHFVVLCGYQSNSRQITVADPLRTNPIAEGLKYSLNIERVLGAILLGVLTDDANCLVIEPRRPAASTPPSSSHEIPCPS